MQGWFHTDMPVSVEEAVLTSIRNKEFTNGFATEKLEEYFKEKLNVKYALYTNSGTSALAISLLSLDIGAGDEVIVPAVGWIATAQAVSITGAKPIIVDTVKGGTSICIEALKTALTDKTKAVIPVNYNGRQVDIDQVKSQLPIGISVIEDSCKSMFSRSFNNKNFSGCNGLIGCFSLGMISMLPSCYGGVIVTNNSDIYKKMKKIKYHGVSYNPEVYEFKSFNFKTSNIFASIANEMIKTIDQRIEKLNKIYDFYNQNLKNSKFKLLPVDIKNGEIPLLIDIYTKDMYSDEIIKYLRSQNVQTLAYHPSLSSANYLDSYPTPNADWITKRTFHLPCGPDQDSKNMKHAIDILLRI